MKVSITLRIVGHAVLLCVFGLFLSSPAASAGEIAFLRNGFSIKHQHRAIIGENTRLYFDGGTSSYVDIPTADIEKFEKDLTPTAPYQLGKQQPLAQPTPNLNELVTSTSATFHLDPDLVNSVIHAESGFDSRAVSAKGARGLMQLMPGTANKLGVEDPFDPRANVRGGSRYLRELLERYNFDLVKALAAYNAGPQRVEQYQGVPPYRETRAYVNKIVREYNRKKIVQQRKAAASARTRKSGNKTTTAQASR
jgi:soluble lytic murein transglycosylase-like protein